VTKEQDDRHARVANKTAAEFDGSLGASKAALGWLYIKAFAILIPIAAVAALIYYLVE
jgi:hypothetical protein